MPREGSKDQGPNDSASVVKSALAALSSLNQSTDSLVKSISKVDLSFSSAANSTAQATSDVMAAATASSGFSVSLQKVSVAFRLVTDSTKTTTNALMQFVKGQNELISGTAAFAAGVSRAGAAILRMPLDVLDSTISTIQMNVARFVRLAQPGTFQLFERAVDDLYATIGKILIPVLQSATAFLRSIGSALAGLTAEGQKTIQMMAAGTAGMIAFAAAATLVTTVMSGGLLPLFSAIIGGITGLLASSKDFRPVFDTLGKIIGGVFNEVGKAVTTLMPIAQPFLDFIGDIGKLLAGTVAFYSNTLQSLAPELGAITAALDTFKDAVVQVLQSFQGVQLVLIANAIAGVATIAAQAAPYIAAFAKVLGNLVSDVVKWIAGLFGISLPNLAAPEGQQKNNVGAAARSTSTSDVSDVLKKARESAFQLGFGGDAPKQTADNTKAIATAMQQTQAKIDRIIMDIEQFPDKARAFIMEGAVTIVRGIASVIPGTQTAGSVAAGISTAIDPAKGPVQKAIEGQLRGMFGGLLG